jgi:hypothetical protein
MSLYSNPPLDGFTPEQAKEIRALRVRYAALDKADQRTGATIADLVPVPVALGSPLCRCLLCPCESRRTIEYPRVCRDCSYGAHHQLNGGVL